MASIVPPVADGVATPPAPSPTAPAPAEERPAPVTLSGALDVNPVAEPEAVEPGVPEIVAPQAVEPVAAEAVPDAVPDPVEAVTISTPPIPTAVAAASEGDGDNLLRLKGVGPKIATLLKSEGINRYAQIAGWSDADLAAIDTKLGSFAGRPVRDNWVDQARLLAAGDVAGYEAKYGKL
nr:hypothetical protein [Sphingobium sufflavum]